MRSNGIGRFCVALICFLSCLVALSAPILAQTATPIASTPAVPLATPVNTTTPTTLPAPTATAIRPAAGGKVKTTPITAEKYRAILQDALRQMDALQKRAPRPLKPILDKLDAAYDVKRADGAVQTVYGNVWSNLSAFTDSNASREQLNQARSIAALRVRALDEWIKAPYYTSTDTQKIIAGLEASGQIRTGPLWWQKALADAWKFITDIWGKITDWLNSLLPKAPATPNVKAPKMDWLWLVFYVFIAVILGLILLFVYRTFGGGWQRRKSPREVELQSEDAALLLLPPNELSSRAEQFAMQGNFREALRHRYLALLLHLDSRGVWRYDSRRTNWEHIASLRRSESKSGLVPPLSDLTRRFDRVRYGGASCDSEGWRQFDNDVRHFETASAVGGGAA